MGLLDYLQNPQSNPALQQGLLQFGLNLMGQRGGNLLQNVGQAGLSGLAGYQQTQDQMRQRSIQDQQLEFQRAQQEAWKKVQEQAEADRIAQAQALKAATIPGTESTAANPYAIDYENSMDSGGAVNFKPAGIDMQRYASALAAAGSQLAIPAYQSLQREKKAPISVAPGASLFDPETGQPVFTNPKEADEDKDVALLRRVYGDGTPAFQEALRQLVAKKTTHPPAATAVSYGSPVPFQIPGTSDVGYAQPGNRPGAPPMVMTDPKTGKPLTRPSDPVANKLPAELQRMQIAGDTMVELLDRYESLLRKHNPRDVATQMNPAVRAEVQSVKRNLELQFKELQALGALAGPDIEIMRQALADPFSVSGAYFGRDGLLAQTRQARDLVRMRSDAVLKSQGRPSADPAASAAPAAPSSGPVRRFNPATGKIE